MALLSRIFGWTPPDDREYVDVQLISPPSLQLLQNPTFHISDPNPIAATNGRRDPLRSTSGNLESASPASTTSALSDAELHPAEQTIERGISQSSGGGGKPGDPSWVARPRNEFILFRCDYVRKHSNHGKRVRRGPGTEAEKTLSKQAAEAWHHLPPEERLFWKERANGERNEHARRYPDYRYRPKKSATGRRRPTTRLSPEKAESSSPGKAVNLPLPGQSSTPNDGSHSHSALAGLKPRPRRSSSVPEFAVAETFNRRLRSSASHGWIAPPGPSSSPADRLTFSHLSRGYTPMPSRLMHQTPNFNSPDFLPLSYSSSAPPTSTIGTGLMTSSSSSSSSLLNWNGERMVPSAPQPTQLLCHMNVSGLGLYTADDSPTFSEYTNGGSPVPSTQLFGIGENAVSGPYLPSGEMWLQSPLLDEGVQSRTRTLATGPNDFQSRDNQCQNNSLHSQVPSTAADCNGASVVYDARRCVEMMMDDYGFSSSSNESMPSPHEPMLECFEGGPGPSALFAMDTDEFLEFHPNF